MAETVLTAEKRDSIGSRYARKYRRENKVPGVFYIHSEDPVHVLLDFRNLTNFLHHSHALIDLKIDGEAKSRKCVIKDVQYHPVTDNIAHIDFLGVKMGEKLTLQVPIQLTGQPEGLKMGAIIEQLMQELEIQCLPKDLPESLEVDVSELEIGKSISVGDLSFENVEILTDPNQAIALLEIPKKVALEAEEEVEAVEGEEDAEASDEDEGEKE